MSDTRAMTMEEMLEKLQSGEFRLKLADLPYTPEEWKAWQRNRCGRWMRDWLERTDAANLIRLKTETGTELARAQGASEVLDSLVALLGEQVDPKRAIAEEESDNEYSG